MRSVWLVPDVARRVETMTCRAYGDRYSTLQKMFNQDSGGLKRIQITEAQPFGIYQFGLTPSSWDCERQSFNCRRYSANLQ